MANTPSAPSMPSMPNLPNPQSFEQIQSDMLSAYASAIGINDFNTGSAVTSFFEVVALTVARASGDLFQILRDFSVDRATGDALKRLATEYGVTPPSAKPATGNVNVIDTSFTKISTTIYAGANPPNIGSTQISVGDASQFPASGSIYIGRGTPDVEGPLPYTTPPVQSGSFWIITLSSPTTKYHNVGESVILAQGGNRVIPANSIAISPGVGSSNNIQYSVTVQAIILDGETEVDNVLVSALTPGSSGNVPAGAIKAFAAPPFTGATVTNPLPFTNGQDSATDAQIRVLIKNKLASQGLGTATAVKASLIGATATESNGIVNTIVSDSIRTSTDGSATVYIDNGTGYEETSSGVGIEHIVDSALGGEKFFQLQTGGSQAPVAKAFLETINVAPFNLVGGDTLAVVVGGVTYQHVFANSDFITPGSATAYEVIASINGDTALGFEATTANNGANVVIKAIAEANDDIQVTTPTSGNDAAVILGFPSNKVETLRLYKNNIPLTKDGEKAAVFTQDQSLWSPTIANGDTLILSIDGTAPITFTILNADFIATNLYTSVAATNSLASWVQVFNNKLTGVTASIVGSQIELVSNLGANNRASLVISPSSTLVTKGMFSATVGLSSAGKASDFTLDRNTAQFELVNPLVAGDVLSAGSADTEATVKTAQISSGNVTLSSDGHIWMLIDTVGDIISTGVVPNTLLDVSKPSTNIVRYTSNVSGAFDNVLVGDYVIVWSAELPSTDRLEGRVNAVTGTTLDILVTPAEYAAATPVTGASFNQGFVVLRSNLAPQKFKVLAGTNTLDQIAQQLNAQTQNLVFSVALEQFLVATTNTTDTMGRILVVTADAEGQQVDFSVGSVGQSQDSLIAFYDSQDYTGDFPLFVHSSFATGSAANPPDSFISSVTTAVNLSSTDPNNLLCILQPYGGISDAQPFGECVQETSIAGTTVGISQDAYVRRLRSADRFFLANPLDFGHQDTAVVIFDNNPTSETFQIPFYRQALTNTGVVSNPFNFNAYDLASGPTASFTSNFTGFNFANFKVLMQAKKVLKPTPSQTAILYRAVQWGRSGEKVTVGYSYPAAANQAITSSVSVSDTVSIFINLSSGAVSPNSIDASTRWNVTVATGVPSAGIDQVTFTWSGTGTNPALSLSGGEYVNIGPQSGFNINNTGVFRVSTQAGYTPTATSFSVQMPTGQGVAQSNIPTLVNGAISLYNPNPTTAAQIVAYVNQNLSQYVSAALVNDGGITGAGVIVLSTYEDTGFVSKYVQLKDGINWIASSNIAGSPQFTFKKALTLPTDVGYAFNNGETIVLVPTTMSQVKNLISVLAVSGFTTVGNVNLADRDSRLELATKTLGSAGSIQVIGGTANQYSVPVIGAAENLLNQYATISANLVASQGVHSDQWFRLQAANAQTKISGFGSNTSIAVIGSSPSVGQSTIKVLGRTLTQRDFGKPRHNVRSRGGTFKVEPQGNLVCISWTGSGPNPMFVKSPINLNDAAGGTLNVQPVLGTSDAQYIILSGNANFTELSIGELITINVSGLDSANNGTFLVTGVSDNGQTIQVSNSNAVADYSRGTFTFNTNTQSGDVFTIGSHNLTAGTDFAVGGTAAVSAANLAATISALPQLSATANGSVVTVFLTFALTYATANSVALAYTPIASSHVTVSGANLAGVTFSAGNFSADSGISEGDTVIFDAPFNVLNQGRHRVIREYNNSIWIENSNVIEEEVTLPYNPVALGFDSTTVFQVNASNHSFFLIWTGTGTEPTLGNANMGDVLTVGTDFASANQGDFMVLNSSAKLAEISELVLPSGSAFILSGAGTYFKVYSAGDVNKYYVWFNVNGTNSDPAPGGGFVGIQVNILSGDTADSVASKTALAITGAAGSDFNVSSLNNTVTITTTGFAQTTNTVNQNVPAPFSVQTLQEGTRTYLECINPSAVNQATVSVTSGVLECHRPQMQFWEYEAAVPGDFFVATGSILGASNAGSYVITKVVNRDTAIVTGNMTSVANASLNNNTTAVFVLEGVPYSGYKKVFLISAEPGAPTLNTIVFDTNAQYPKINASSNVALTSVSKLNFNTAIKNGLDSYRFNTGLIAQANRIIYGDPRDNVTYPGVGAAGAEIFVSAPLALRIQVAVDVRLQTGAAFSAVSQQIVNNVAYLINSNPVGQSIDISSIVSTVRSIPGVISVAISSPQYSPTNDLIPVAPNEKALIINPTTDISVSQIGA